MESTAASALSGINGIIILLSAFMLAIPTFIGLWKMFEKADLPTWQAIVPLYNLYVIIEHVKRPWWWVLVIVIPPFVMPGVFLIHIVGSGVALAFWTIVNIDLAKMFSQKYDIGVGMAFAPFVFYLILGFGGAVYMGKESEK